MTVLSSTRPYWIIAGLLACSPAFGATIQQQNFINAVFEDLLGRPADSGAVAYYSSQLDMGATDFDVAYSVDTSSEYYGGLVGSYYESYLHRMADPSSIAFVNSLVGGAADAAVEAIILGSDEYFNTRGGGDNTTFLNALYEDLLGRPADPGALATFLPLLNGSTSRSQVAAIVLASNEYDHDLVNSYYERFLGRAADAGSAGSVTELSLGTTDETVIAQILGSAEFFGLAQTQADAPAQAPEPGSLAPLGLGAVLVIAGTRGRRRRMSTSKMPRGSSSF